MTAKAILFTNNSNEDFVGKWNNVEYNLPKGVSMMFEAHLASHFAKHLAIRELNREGKSIDKKSVAIKASEFLSQENSIEAQDTSSLQSEILNYGKMKKDELLKVAEEKGIKVDEKAKKAEIVNDLEQFEGAE